MIVKDIWTKNGIWQFIWWGFISKQIPNAPIGKKWGSYNNCMIDTVIYKGYLFGIFELRHFKHLWRQ